MIRRNRDTKQNLNIVEKKPTRRYIPKLKPYQRASSWLCKICFDEFGSRKDLFDHRKHVHEDTEDIVSREEAQKFIYDEVHDFFTCNDCSAEFQTKEEVEKHHEKHEEKYECQPCKKTISGALNFSSHMQQHRIDNHFPCPLCNHTTSRKPAMLTHIVRFHFRKYDLQCQTCGKGFIDASRFKEHENVHLGLKPFVCIVCNKEFVYSRYLVDHQVRSHRVKVLDKDSKTQCRVCSRSFVRRETLMKHVLSKHPTSHKGPAKKKHLCEVCGQGFSRTDTLRIHYRKHTGEKPFCCVYCSKRFIRKDHLIMHERVHNGEKPYSCEICDKSFNQDATLRIHMRTHTGERPYVCPHCSTGCVTKGALNVHIKSCFNPDQFFPTLEVELSIDDNDYDVRNLYRKEKKKSADKSSPTRRKIKVEIEDDEYTPPGYKKKKRVKKMKPVPKIRKQEHKIWTCRRCLVEFETRRDLTEHTKLYHVEEPKDQHTFKYDEEQDQYTCNTCSAEYQTKEEVEGHISKVHEEFYTCEICKHTSKKAYSFAVHMKGHSTDDTYTCPLCSYNTPRRTCLQTHINRVHYHKFYYTCATCGKGFNDSVIFKEHNNEHLGIKPFVCVVCNKEFVYSRYMLIHQTRYHTVHIEGTLHKTQCSICLKVFSKVATLLKHITTKHSNSGDDKPEKRHLCDMCGKGFGTSDKLKIHYRIHTGDKPFACRYCDKRFTKKDYLVMHERVHTGEKPYPCEYCGKCFNQAASLRIHVRGHTGERPYVCQFCNGGYISRGSLNLHMKICNGVAT